MGGGWMIGSIEIKQFGPTPEHTKAAQGTALRGALQAGGIMYHSRFMAKHFTIAGGIEYGYLPRKGQSQGVGSRNFFRSYSGRKQKQKGHQRPLVWSGASEQLARIQDVRATRKRARIIQHARGLNRRNPRSEIDMAKEIRTVSAAESTLVVSTVGDEFMKRIRSLPTRSRKKLA